MGCGMKAPWNAAATVLKHTAVVAPEITMVVNRHAPREVGAVIEKDGPASPARRPRTETPPPAAKHSDRDSGSESKSYSQHDAGRRRQQNVAGIGAKHRPPDGPGIVVGNVNHGRIDRENLNHAALCNHALLRRRHQPIILLRLQPHGLDSVHSVAWLVVIGVTELGRPSRISRQIIEDGGKCCEAFDGRVPRHAVRRGRALIRGQTHVLVQPGIRCGNLVRIRGSGQYLGHQRVRIERDGGHELIQLIRVQFDVRAPGRLRVDIQLGRRYQQRAQHEDHRSASGRVLGNCASRSHCRPP
jgi:hypothetical protein